MLMIESSKDNRETYPRKCFWTQERGTRVKFNRGLSGNRPSNNWARGINKVYYGLCENSEWYVSRAFLYFACVLLSGCLKSVSSCCSYIYAASRSQGDGEMKLQSLPLKRNNNKKAINSISLISTNVILAQNAWCTWQVNVLLTRLILLL